MKKEDITVEEFGKVEDDGVVYRILYFSIKSQKRMASKNQDQIRLQRTFTRKLHPKGKVEITLFESWKMDSDPERIKQFAEFMIIVADFFNHEFLNPEPLKRPIAL